MQAVSVSICCYTQRFAHRGHSRRPGEAAFSCSCRLEIVLVDNASTDDTAGLSRRIWDLHRTGVGLRIVHEPLPGQMNAAGKASGRPGTIVFRSFATMTTACSAPIISRAFRDILADDPGVAACAVSASRSSSRKSRIGSMDYAEAFATGPQGDQ